ncbi:molybdenum ABC transporter ATP-binding protein [Thermomonas sp. S9]|uniref:molybdenum ABC transporter ATP-binding protein n=1 Tax=Thermomonas sp. S9 TaxID=2885203 RepID=UPI001AC14DEB|nr:molybdenum ABC transporter ATP-binding protein [Thermomonas sp. S9]MBN8715814.1 molybdenum ABC transporter ATP-binding protein [Xanthomonadales bacterium]MBN8794303.1 molybdenum ABC transporter ATP-binding protein [Stenotrophomonas nitritireducens]MCR6495907.1 molybdenum ABC transporter ATP-binding protein [Thermomonas sp. S9]
MRGNIHIALRVAHGGFRLDVDLVLPSRGVTVVFGPSGSGKSTLLRAIAGLEPNAVGEVRIGSEIWQDARRQLPAHRRATGVVFQHTALLPHLSVEGNLRYGWKRAGAPHALLDDWIERLALAPLLARRPDTLSGGERQRVALARALVCNPHWLLLDEPLSALDGERRAEILPYLEAVRRESGIPILYVTHAMDEAARLADHLVLMDTGKVVAAGPALDVLNRTDLPLALREDAGVVLEARVDAADAHGLLTLQTRAGALHAHGPAYAPGTLLRLRVQARDVSLALQRHADSSLLNLLPATLLGLDPQPCGQVLARLDASGVPLLARISHRSVERLELRPGMALWAQVKAVALLV